MAHLFTVALCLAALVASSFAAFDGVWVDNDQRVLTLCTTDSGTKLQGSYQEIGLFQGTVSGNTASGTFYLASSPDFVCTRRSFSWRLSTSNNELNGTWSCVDNGGINGHWNAVRQSSFSTHQTCGVLASSGSLAGRWNLGTNVGGNTWDFCVEPTNGGKYQSSYEFIGATTGKPGRGYSHGESFENGRLLIGTWSEAVNVLTSDNHAGFNIIGLGEDGQLFEYYWLLPLDDSDVIALTPGKHGTQRVARFSTSLRDTTDCLRNQGTAVNFSDASSIGMSLVLVATVVVALFSLWL